MNDKVQILGGKAPTSVQILSVNSPPPQDAVPPVVTVHEELVTEDEKVRANRQDGDPEIRVRYPTSPGSFEKAKQDKE